MLLFGLLGGAVLELLASLWWWLLNNPLSTLVPEGVGVRAVLYAGVPAILLSTHGVFLGLLLRKLGVMAATLGLSILTMAPTAALLERILYPEWPATGLDALVDPLRYNGVSMALIAGIGELLLRLLRGRLDSVAHAALVGLAVPAGWTVGFLVQLVFPGFDGSWASSFGVTDWLIWLLAVGLAGLVFAGLIPAVLTRRRPSVGVTAPGAIAVAPDALTPGVASPGVAGDQEHPKASQVLVFGVLGLLVLAPLAVAAWVIGSRAKAEMALYPGRYRPSSSLQTGYVLGIIGTVVWVAGILLVAVLLAGLFVASSR